MGSTSGDREAAADIILRAAARDPELAGAMLRAAAVDACLGVIREVRDLVWNPPTPAQLERQSARVRALGAGNLFTFPLPGGQVLGDAKKAEVSDAADFYEKQASDMAHKGRWLRSIANMLPNSRVTVRRALSLEQIEALKAG